MYIDVEYGTIYLHMLRSFVFLYCNVILVRNAYKKYCL